MTNQWVKNQEQVLLTEYVLSAIKNGWKGLKNKMHNITCPQCLNGHQLRMTIHIIVECPFPQKKLDKSAIRTKEVQILGTDWDNAIIYCSECGLNLGGWINDL